MAEQDGDISPHVRIRIDPERKREWLEYADENDLSLTDLIKTAVDNTISDTWVLESEVERSDVGEVDVDLDGVDDGIDEVLERLTAIESQLDRVTLQDTGSPGLTEYRGVDCDERRDGDPYPKERRCCSVYGEFVAPRRDSVGYSHADRQCNEPECKQYLRESINVTCHRLVRLYRHNKKLH